MNQEWLENQGAVTYRSPVGSIVLSALFVVACLIVVYLCVSGLMSATGFHLMVLLISSTFPILMLIVSVLRIVAIAGRRVRLSQSTLEHRQMFKNYTVKLEDIRRIETLKNQHDELDTVKIHWSGTPFYIDARAIDGFDEFVDLLVRRAGRAVVTEVTEFSSSPA